VGHEGQPIVPHVSIGKFIGIIRDGIPLLTQRLTDPDLDVRQAVMNAMAELTQNSMSITREIQLDVTHA
jgi:hypothetical protein